MKRFPVALAIIVLSLAGSHRALSQTMDLQQVISQARERSVQALEAKSGFVSDYWAWRSYQAGRLPSLTVYGELGGFDRSLRLLQNYETGQMQYVTNYNMQNRIGLRASQNITFTGGTLSLYSDLTRIDQFGAQNPTTWFAQPLSLSYNQPLFGYNQFKWDKLIAPKEYERARRKYLESMEDVTLTAVSCYYSVMLAQRTYDASVSNYENTLRMLDVASNRLALGSVTREEYLQLELRSLNDSISINENAVALKEARMVLNSLLGNDESSVIETVFDDNLPALTIDYELVLDKCSENSSFHLDNDIDILNADAAIAKAKASRGITMQLNATFGLSNSAAELPKTYRNLLDQEVVGLTFTVPVFDWGMGRGKIKKAEAAAKVVKAQVAQAENDKRISLFTAVGQFNNQRKLCSVSRRAKDISAERHRLVMDNFRSGKASVTELNTARTEADQALQKYIGDLKDYWTYYYTLRKLTLYDFIAGEDINVSYDEMLQ